jgi:hypothetical protein
MASMDITPVTSAAQSLETLGKKTFVKGKDGTYRQVPK